MQSSGHGPLGNTLLDPAPHGPAADTGAALGGAGFSPPPHAECLVLLFSPELVLELGVLLLARRVRHLGNCNITSW